MEIGEKKIENSDEKTSIIDTLTKFLLMTEPSEKEKSVLKDITPKFFIYIKKILESFINGYNLKNNRNLKRNINYIRKIFFYNNNPNIRYNFFSNIGDSSTINFILLINVCFAIFREICYYKSKQKEYSDIKHLVLLKLNNILSFVSIIIGKFYVDKIINDDMLETYLKFLIILSISWKTKEEPKKNDKIVNMMFFKESLRTIKLTLNKIYKYQNDFTERQEKIINNIILFINDYIIEYSNEKPINVFNKSYLSYNDYYSSSIIDLIFIISKMKNNEIIKNFIQLLTNIYAFSFKYDNMMSPIIKILEPLLINIHLKKIEEINLELNISSFPLQLLKGLIQKEEKIIKEDPTLLKNGFYLGSKICGISSEIDNLGDEFLLIFGFNLHEINNQINNIKEWTLIHIRNNTEQKESQLKIWLSQIDKINNQYSLLVSIKDKIAKTNIIIKSKKTYIFSFQFYTKRDILIKKQKLKISYTCSSERDPLFIQQNDDIAISGFNKENVNIYIGCDINIPINFTKESNTFTGFIGTVIISKIISKKDPEDLANLILSLKGDYASCILMSLDKYNNKLFVENNEKKYHSKNQKTYNDIQEKIIQLNENDSKFIESIKAIISPNSCILVEYQDEIDYLNLYNNYDLFEKSKKQNMLVKTNYLDIKQKSGSSKEEKMITIFPSFFNSRFHTFENKNTLDEFIKYDGIYYLCLLLEYYYQIICNIEKNNNSKKDDNVKVKLIYEKIEKNIFELINFFKDNVITKEYCETFHKEINQFFYQMTITLKKLLINNIVNKDIYDIIKYFIKNYITIINHKNRNDINEYIETRNKLLDLLLNISLFFRDDNNDNINIYLKIDYYLEAMNDLFVNGFLNDLINIKFLDNILSFSCDIFDDNSSKNTNKALLKKIKSDYSNLLIQLLKKSYSDYCENVNNPIINKKSAKKISSKNLNIEEIKNNEKSQNIINFEFLDYYLQKALQQIENHPLIFTNLMNALFKSELIEEIPEKYIYQIREILEQKYIYINENRNNQIICESTLRILSAYYLTDKEKEKYLHVFLSKFPFNYGFFKSIISSLKHIKYFVKDKESLKLQSNKFLSNSTLNINEDNDLNENTNSINNENTNSIINENKTDAFDLYPLKNMDLSILNKDQYNILEKLIEDCISMLFSDKNLLAIYDFITEDDAQNIYDILNQNFEPITKLPEKSIYKHTFGSEKEITPFLFIFKWKKSNKERKKILIDDIKNYHQDLLEHHNFPFIFKFLLLISYVEENEISQNKENNNDNNENININCIIDLICFITNKLDICFKNYEPNSDNQNNNYYFICNVINLLIVMNNIFLNKNYQIIFCKKQIIDCFYKIVHILEKTGLLYSNYCFELQPKCGKIVSEICYDLFMILLKCSFKENKSFFEKTFIKVNKQKNEVEYYTIFYLMDLNRENILVKDSKTKKILEKYIKEYQSLNYIHKQIFFVKNENEKKKIHIFGKKINQLEDVNLSLYIMAKTFLYLYTKLPKELYNYLLEEIVHLITENIFFLWTKKNHFYGQKICKKFPLYSETKSFFEAHAVRNANDFDVYKKFFLEEIPVKIKENQLNVFNVFSSKLLDKKQYEIDNNIKEEEQENFLKKINSFPKPVTNNDNDKNNASYYKNSNNWFFQFEKLKKNYIIINPKNYLLKRYFSLNFKDIFFKDELFQKIKSSYLCTYRNNKALNAKTKQLNYPIKQKNFSNSLEPKTFLRRDYNIYNRDFFKVSHNYIKKELIKENDKKNLFFYPHEYYSKKIFMNENNYFDCELITTQFVYFGKMYIGEEYLCFESRQFIDDDIITIDIDKFYKYAFSVRDQDNKTSKKKHILILIKDIKEIIRRRTLLMKQAIEIFNKNGKSYFFNFFKTDKCDKVYKILSEINYNLLKINKQFILVSNDGDKLKLKNILNDFRNGNISNYNYLLYLNKISSRTYNDLTQYPVFPWIILKINTLYELTNNIGKNCKNNNKKRDEDDSLRDMNYPVSMQKKEKREIEIYKYLEDKSKHPFHLGTHYSTSSYIFYYLMRMNPYGENLIKLQNYKQENPNRMFLSFKDTQFVLNQSNDNRELIPDIYCYIDYMCNLNCSFFGIRTNSWLVDDFFISKLNEKLDENLNLISTYVESLYRHKKILNDIETTKKLDKWVDIIFGKKQLPLEDSNIAYTCNIFGKLTYEQKTNLKKKMDKYKKKYKNKENKIISKIQNNINIINNFGICPCQILTENNSYEEIQNVQKFKNNTVVKEGDYYFFTKLSNNQYLSIMSKGNSMIRIVDIFENKEDKGKHYSCGNFENEISHMYVNTNNLNIPIYKPNYAISAITFNNEDNQIHETFILTCRFLGNYFKVQNMENTIMVLCEDFVTTIVARNSEKNDTHFFTGLKNGKIIEWKITKIENEYNRNKYQYFLSFRIKEKKHVYAHKSSITAIEINTTKEIIASAGEDKFIYIRKLFDFELLTSIDLTYTFGNPIISRSPNIIPSLIKISDLNCIYVVLYNYTMHKSIIRGYTLNGLFFAQTVEYKDDDFSYSNISFNKNWNLIVGLYYYNVILLLNSYDLKVKYNYIIDEKNSHKSCKWLEYDASTKEFIILYNNQCNISQFSEDIQAWFDS